MPRGFHPSAPRPWGFPSHFPIQTTVNPNVSGYSWVHSYHGSPLPANAVVAGRDSDGTTIYVGRSTFMGDQLPCKVIPAKNAAYVSHNGHEHLVTNYEIMCEKKLRWMPGSNGYVPPGAVDGGRTSSGEQLYIARTHHANSQTVGKLHPSHQCVYIPYGGREISCRTYEVLVYD